MSSGSGASGRSSGMIVLTVILVIVGILAIVAGVIYLVEPAKSLPSIMGTITHPASRANAHRNLRGWTALAVGVILLIAAWFTGRARASTQS